MTEFYYFDSITVICLVLVTMVLYIAYSAWESRRNQLREYTHVPDIVNMRMVRVRTDAEGRQLMREAKEKAR